MVTGGGGGGASAIVFWIYSFLLHKMNVKQGWIQELPVGGADATRAACAMRLRFALE